MKVLFLTLFFMSLLELPAILNLAGTAQSLVFWKNSASEMAEFNQAVVNLGVPFEDSMVRYVLLNPMFLLSAGFSVLYAVLSFIAFSRSWNHSNSSHYPGFRGLSITGVSFSALFLFAMVAVYILLPEVSLPLLWVTGGCFILFIMVSSLIGIVHFERHNMRPGP